jgi:hypothetical protein
MALTYKRTAFPLFELKNNAYVNASITFYKADVDTGGRSDDLATVYDSYTGGSALSNPYTLDSDGRAADTIFFDEPVVAVINTSAIGEHTTGIYIPTSAQYRGEWSASEHYLSGDIVIDGEDGDNTRNLYVCDTEHDSVDWTSDITNWIVIIDATIPQQAQESADEAAASALAASGSATAAASSASSASTQASASYAYAEEAHTHRDDAQGYADAASSSATAAAASAVSAAADAASLISIAGFQYAWSTSTASTDPTTGKIKANNASLSLATEIYISETTAAAQAIASEIATWDDSSSSVKGKIKLIKASDPISFAVFNVTGSITDNGTWDTLTVEYVTGAGSFSASDTLYVQFIRNGDAGTSVGVDFQAFTTAGTATWTKPAGARIVRVLCVGGGCGGGAGRRGANGTDRSGGGGGSSGAWIERVFDANQLSSTVTTSVGVGGYGKDGVTTNDSSSSSNLGDTTGELSYFGNYLHSLNNSYGQGTTGGTSAGAGGLTLTDQIGFGAVVLEGVLSNQSGGDGAISVGADPIIAAASFLTIQSPAGGGGGGGLDTANTQRNGGRGGGAQGGFGSLGTSITYGVRGTAGTSAGGGGGDGGNGCLDGSSPITFGGGGGGGASNPSGEGGDGGDGGQPGGGGGGGGASANGYKSGAGGKGGDGAVFVWTYY